MKLAVSIIMDALKNWIAESDVRQPDALVQGFSTFPNPEVNQELVYLCGNGQDFSQWKMPDICLFFSVEDYYKNKNIDNRVLLRRGITEIHVAVLLEEVFRKYSNWSDSLKESLLKEEGVKALMQLSIPVFQNPISFVNLEYRVLFHADVPGGVQLSDKYGNEMVEKQVFGERMIETINNSEKYLESMTLNKAVFWEEETWGGQFMAVNDLEYSILINNCNRPFRPGDNYLLEYLMSIVMKAVKLQNLYPAYSIDDLRQIITKAISADTHIDSKEIQKLAEGFHWSLNDLFLCTVIYPSPSDLIRKTLLYFCIQLETYIKGAKAFALDAQIVVIFNLTQNGLSRDQIMESLEGFLKKYMLQGSLSLTFSDFYELQPYIQQALAAYEMGIRSEGSKILYLIEDHILDYMLQNALGTLDIKYLMPQGLLDLIQHDQRFKTNYVQILKTYLENKCNIADTVRELYLHRNTFLYQIQKIRDILGMDLNDRDVRLLLLIILRYDYSDSKFE